MDAGFSPLDERLALVPRQRLTPALVESIVRLSVGVPFAQVPALLAHFTGVTVSAETVRRLTEAAGAIQVGIDTAAVARIERELPAPPPGPSVQLISVDGAMVSLVGGAWSEVKTLAIGTVGPAVVGAAGTDAAGTGAATGASGGGRTTDLSYFSRLTDAASFNRLATVETQRRGTEAAQTVVAVVDGAEWCQGFIDHQRQDAVRILDFAHALSHLSSVAQTRFGPGTAAASEWLGQQAHALRHGQEETVISRLATLAETGSAEARAVTLATHGYLSRRLEQIRYQAFAEAGYPIGSGCVESANKLVVEARLKGSGMHWCREHVNPMLALRTVMANRRWDETWPELWTTWRQQARSQAHGRRSPRQADTLHRAAAAPVVVQFPAAPDDPPTSAPSPPREKTIVDGKPTANHIWKKTSPFRAKR